MSLKYYASWAFATWFGFWQRHEYNAVWDKKLKELLDSEDKCVLGKYTLKVGDCEIWVANRWYSYGCLWRVQGKRTGLDYRPSVKTMVRLAKLEDKLRRENELAELTSTLNTIKSGEH